MNKKVLVQFSRSDCSLPIAHQHSLVYLSTPCLMTSAIPGFHTDTFSRSFVHFSSDAFRRNSINHPTEERVLSVPSSFHPSRIEGTRHGIAPHARGDERRRGGRGRILRHLQRWLALLKRCHGGLHWILLLLLLYAFIDVRHVV